MASSPSDFMEDKAIMITYLSSYLLFKKSLMQHYLWFWNWSPNLEIIMQEKTQSDFESFMQGT